jgi:protein-L-isoaspartate(D-aspartate) O-methyltransferase
VSSVQAFRDFYAEFIVKSCGSSDARLIAAFAAVPREEFVGPLPWRICVGWGEYLSTSIDDARLLYQDVMINLVPDRGINNGQPSLHAACMAACNPRNLDTVVHIGAGTGYYTAVLAHLVGTGGRVVAYEIESDLAERARENLQEFSNVAVVARSAADEPLPSCDVVYVSAGATHPLPTWLDALNIGGRLIFPLTSNKSFGWMLLVTRTSDLAYAAKIVMRAAFIHCVGARDDRTSEAISAAFEERSLPSVRSLRRDGKPDATAWLIGSDWWLSTADSGP